MTNSFVRLSLFTLLIVFATGASAADAGMAPNPVVATVNGDSITTSQLERELVRIHTANRFEVQRKDFSLDRLVQRLIDDVLLAQEARSIGLDADEAVAAEVKKHRENQAYLAMLAKVFPDTLTASDIEIRGVFARDFQMFDVQLICVTDSLLARAIADSIRSGVSMDQLAMRHAVDKYKTAGGHSGDWTTIDLPEEVRSAALAAKNGDIIGPTVLWRTFAILRINGHKDPDYSMLDTLRPAITTKVIQDKREARVRAYTDSLRNLTTIHVDSTQLDALLNHMRSAEPPSETTIAWVGLHTLNESDLRKKYIHRAAMKPDREARAILNDVLDEQISTMLLRDAAMQQGFGDRPDVAFDTKVYEDSLLVEAYLEDVVQATIHITPADIQAYYDGHLSAFRDPPKLKIATLTRQTEAQADEDYKAVASGTNFAWLARRNSGDDFREKGGEHDWMRGDELPLDVFKSIDSLKIGQVSQPLKMDSSFVLFQVMDRTEGEVKSLKQVTELIKKQIMRQKQYEAIDQTVQALRRSAKIEIFEDAIKKLKISGRNDE